MKEPRPVRTDDARFRITENASLLDRNTFRVPARARWLLEIRDTGALADALAELPEAPLLVLGGGSNILFTRDWPGVVVLLAAQGIDIIEEVADRALVRVQAAENWNGLVHWSLAQGFTGLENLVLIPGNVGAAPIQNIGAYGVEVAEFVHAVEAFDRNKGRIATLPCIDCEFGYRDSVFKHSPDRYIVTAVQFKLPRNRAPQLDYAGVRAELATADAGAGDHSAIADAITRLRLRKLPDPAVIGNAGSFFKNPVINAELARQLQECDPAMPAWPVSDGRVKLSAAWLIESCSFSGLRDNGAAVSEQHALVLVNHGEATGAQILALAERIQSGVAEKFGVTLEPEPLIV